MPIDVKEAVKTAKSYVGDLFAAEDVGAPTLEEVWYDDDERVWFVTIGIRHRSVASGNAFAPHPQHLADYKIVRISDIDGEPKSIKNYERTAA